MDSAIEEVVGIDAISGERAAELFSIAFLSLSGLVRIEFDIATSNETEDHAVMVTMGERAFALTAEQCETILSGSLGFELPDDMANAMRVTLERLKTAPADLNEPNRIENPSVITETGVITGIFAIVEFVRHAVLASPGEKVLLGSSIATDEDKTRYVVGKVGEVIYAFSAEEARIMVEAINSHPGHNPVLLRQIASAMSAIVDMIDESRVIN